MVTGSAGVRVGHTAATASSYRCEVRQEGNRLIATRKLEHAAGPTVIPPEQYAQFREYWSKCARADAMDIVLFRGNSPFST